METLLQLLTSGVVVSVVVGLLKEFVKAFISPRFGDIGVQAFVLLVSFAVAGLGVAFNLLPPQVIKTTILVFTSALSVYETFYKAIYSKAIKNR